MKLLTYFKAYSEARGRMERASQKREKRHFAILVDGDVHALDYQKAYRQAVKLGIRIEKRCKELEGVDLGVGIPGDSQMNWAEEIEKEMDRQDQKWGLQNHNPYHWNTIIGEEYGEACEASLGEDMESYKRELFSVAASAVQAILSVNRGERHVPTDVEYCKPNFVNILIELDRVYRIARAKGNPYLIEMAGEVFQEYQRAVGEEFDFRHSSFNGVPIKVRHDLGFKCTRFFVRVIG